MRGKACKRLIASLFMCMALLVLPMGMGNVLAMEFSGTESSIGYFSHSPKVVPITTDQGQKASFMYTGKKLFLKDASGKIALDFPCRFIGIDFSDYDVKAIHATNPQKTFWVISCLTGNGRQMGFWIVGQMKDGTFVKYKQPNSFPNVGKPHVYRIEANGDTLKLTGSVEYWPEGATYGYQRKFAVDYQANLFWDESADWFGEERIV